MARPRKNAATATKQTRAKRKYTRKMHTTRWTAENTITQAVPLKPALLATLNDYKRAKQEELNEINQMIDKLK